jgi:hypothetical protein
VQLVGTATESAPFARDGFAYAHAAKCGSAAPSKPTGTTIIVKPEWAGTTYAASAETAISSIAYAATATTAEGPPAAIPAT